MSTQPLRDQFTLREFLFVSPFSAPVKAECSSGTETAAHLRFLGAIVLQEEGANVHIASGDEPEQWYNWVAKAVSWLCQRLRPVCNVIVCCVTWLKGSRSTAVCSNMASRRLTALAAVVELRPLLVTVAVYEVCDEGARPLETGACLVLACPLQQRVHDMLEVLQAKVGNAHLARQDT